MESINIAGLVFNLESSVHTKYYVFSNENYKLALSVYSLMNEFDITFRSLDNTLIFQLFVERCPYNFDLSKPNELQSYIDQNSDDILLNIKKYFNRYSKAAKEVLCFSDDLDKLVIWL